MLERDRERVDRLARQHGPHRLDGAAHRDRQALLVREAALESIDADQARLHVAGVLRGLEEEVVGAAFVQAARLGFVVLDELLEGDATCDGDRLGRRPHRARDEPRLVVRRGRIRLRSRQRRRRAVDLYGALVQAVLGEDERSAAEGVRLQDVGARLEVTTVNGSHDLRTREVEHLVAALELGPAEVLG